MMANRRSMRRQGPVVAEAEFQLIYDGDLVQDGAIPVRDLAPSLLALADLFSRANGLVNPLGTDVRLEVRATDVGSFDIHMILRTLEESQRALGGDTADALANLQGYIWGGGGFFAFVLWLRGRRLRSQQRQDDGVRVETEDGDAIVIPSEVLRMYENLEIRRLTRDFTRPLKRNGLDTMEVRREQETVIRLTKPDADAFEADDVQGTETVEGDSTADLTLTIANVPLENPDEPWRFDDGDRVFPADISDQGFVDDVAQRRVGLFSGDQLRVRLRRRQLRSSSSGRLRNHYEVEQVHGRVEGAEPEVTQPPLSLGSGPGVLDVVSDDLLPDDPGDDE
jgi:hypothetical protein